MLQGYKIIVNSYLDENWSSWFEGLVILHDAKGRTIFSAQLTDQAALHGVLTKLRDLGLELVSVNLVKPDAKHSPGRPMEKRKTKKGRRSP